MEVDILQCRISELMGEVEALQGPGKMEDRLTMMEVRSHH